MGECAGPGPFERVLEVGCAEGAFTLVLAERAASVTALDISSVALSARAKIWRAGARGLRRNRHPDLVARPREVFDLIVLGDVLYYLDKPMARAEFEKTFARLKSWLAPGGRILLAHGFAGKRN